MSKEMNVSVVSHVSATILRKASSSLRLGMSAILGAVAYCQLGVIGKRGQVT